MMNLLNSQARTWKEFVELWYALPVVNPGSHSDFSGKCGLKYHNMYNAGETDLMEFLPV